MLSIYGVVKLNVTTIGNPDENSYISENDKKYQTPKYILRCSASEMLFRSFNLKKFSNNNVFNERHYNSSFS